MTTALYTHPSCLLHENGFGHPESPDRLRAILAELEKPDYAELVRRDAPAATREQISHVHDPDYIDGLLARVPHKGYAAIDPDTSLSPGSGEAALHAAGAVVAAVDEVMSGKITNAFCAIRPPGHHAEHSLAMGFCLFDNIAVGVAHALRIHKLTRIAIVDFDVHHGNGTEDWVRTQKHVLFFSSHQFPLWPGSGRASDQGPLGNIVNIPLPEETNGYAFRQAMQTQMLPKIDAYAPEFIFISAGFDAHRDDPLANMNLLEEDYFWVTSELCNLANKHCQGRIVSCLEGGYDLEALAKSAGAHVKALQKG